MSGLGDHAGEMIYILLAILLIVAVMVAVMTLSKTAKKSTNQKTAELGQQVADVDNQFFEEWDMNTCSGSQLKQFMKSASSKDCAVLVQTLSLTGNQTVWGANSNVKTNAAIQAAITNLVNGVSTKTVSGTSVVTSGGGAKETTFNGTAFTDSVGGRLPVVMIDFKDANAKGSHKAGDNDGAIVLDNSKGSAFVVQTALKTNVYNSCLVNYGTILKNAVHQSGISGENYTSILASTETSAGSAVQATTTISAMDWDASESDSSQTIAYLDGRFHTKQEFAVSQSGINLRYDVTTDNNMAGKTMYIDDNAKFNTYILVDGANKYKGVVFIEKK